MHICAQYEKWETGKLAVWEADATQLMQSLRLLSGLKAWSPFIASDQSFREKTGAMLPHKARASV